MVSLLPKSYQTKLTAALEIIMRDFETLPVEDIKNFWNPAKCREDLLPYLAVCLGANQWDSSWDVKQKRKVCQNSLEVNRKKGTLGSLKEALRSLNLNCTIIEWWQDPEHKLAKGTAELNLHENDIIYSEEQYKTIYKLVNEVKRLSLLLSFRKTNAIQGASNIGAGLATLSKISIPYTPLRSRVTNITKNITSCAGLSTLTKLRVG